MTVVLRLPFMGAATGSITAAAAGGEQRGVATVVVVVVPVQCKRPSVAAPQSVWVVLGMAAVLRTTTSTTTVLTDD